MAKAPTDLRSLARSHTEMCVRTLVGIAQQSPNHAARVAAATHLLDRGWGKAPATLAGADGEGAIEIIIRTLTQAAAVEVRSAHQDVLELKAIDAQEGAK